MVDRDLLAQALEREAARVFEYCRALVGREDVAMSVAEAALDSARSMLEEPDRLRAWLLDLARRQAAPAEPAMDPQPGQGVLQPDSREVLELVYRHGIHREDLGAVLGMSAAEAAALLAAAERELDRLEPLTAPDQAEAPPGPVDPTSGQSMLPPPDRLRAWLFALARQEALAVDATRTARGAAPGAELVRYIGNYPATTDAGRELLPTSWWQGSVAPPTRRRRVRIAALAILPLVAALGVAVYLSGGSRPVGSSAASRASSAASGSAGLPRLVLPNASLAAAAPHASPSPTVPIWALFPASPSPVVPPPPSPSAPAPSPTPKPSATATPKPSATATPKPSATATPKPSATATPKPSATATPKPSATASPKPSTKASATPTPTKTTA